MATARGLHIVVVDGRRGRPLRHRCRACPVRPASEVRRTTMARSDRTMIGLFADAAQATAAVRALRDAGFQEETIGILTPDTEGHPTTATVAGVHVVTDNNTPVGATESGEGAVAGTILGTTMGALLAATGALVIPGIGPFIAGGILATAIAGGVVGALAGALVG